MSRQGSQRREQRRRLLVSWTRSRNADSSVAPPGRRAAAEYAAEALPERQPAIATLLPTGRGGLALAAAAILTVLAGSLLVGGYQPAIDAVGRLCGERFARSVAALRSCFDPRSMLSLAGWLSQILLVVAAAVALVVRLMRRHRRDDYRGRYRAWGWLAAIFIGASFAAQVPLARLVGLLVVEATGIPFGPDGFGWWVAAMSLLCGGVALWAVLPLHERLATAVWLSAGLLSWTMAAACGWIGAGRGSLAAATQAAWVLGSGFMAIAMLAAARSVIREVRGEAGRSSRPRAAAPAVGRQAERAVDEAPVAEPDAWHEYEGSAAGAGDDEGETSYTDGFTDGSDEDRPTRHLSKAERKRLKKLARLNRVA
jgi:hypothetical protein